MLTGSFKVIIYSPSDVVTVPRRANVFIGVAPARLAVVSYGEGVSIVSVGTPLTMSPLVAHWAGSTPVLLCGQRVLVVINGGNLTGWAEVVRGNIQ